jgi:hypothetical protein
MVLTLHLCILYRAQKITETFALYDINRFNIHGSVHRNNILMYKSQQDAHDTEFILSDDCSTCFRYHYHPSSAKNAIYSIEYIPQNIHYQKQL